MLSLICWLQLAQKAHSENNNKRVAKKRAKGKDQTKALKATSGFPEAKGKALEKNWLPTKCYNFCRVFEEILLGFPYNNDDSYFIALIIGDFIDINIFFWRL